MLLNMFILRCYGSTQCWKDWISTPSSEKTGKLARQTKISSRNAEFLRGRFPSLHREKSEKQNIQNHTNRSKQIKTKLVPCSKLFNQLFHLINQTNAIFIHLAKSQVIPQQESPPKKYCLSSGLRETNGVKYLKCCATAGPYSNSNLPPRS